MTRLYWGVMLALILLAVTACDVVRYPGDEQDNGYKPETPPGAPGPVPPSEPVGDPYGLGDAPDTGPGASPETDPGADQPDGGPETPASTDAADESETETADTGDTGDTPEGPAPDQPETEDPAEPAPEEPDPVVVFSFVEPGQLQPGSGTGTQDTETVFSPDMRFPIKSAPAFLQSQVWGWGGGIKGGDQCDPRNYEYPWQDNFCETRSSNRNSPYCPVSKIHQGQDIRVGTADGCNQLRRTSPADRALYEVVAVEDGIVQSIGTYTVTQRSGPRIYKYMHMNMRALQVSAGDTITKGQTLGYVSNDFGGTATTFHLHFEMLQNTADSGWVHVPPYTSLVAAYERRENGIGEEIIPNVAVASASPPVLEGPDAPVITEGFVAPDAELVTDPE